MSERLKPARRNPEPLSANFFGQISTFGNFFSPQVTDGPPKMKIRQNRHRWTQSIPIPKCSEILVRIGAHTCALQAET